MTSVTQPAPVSSPSSLQPSTLRLTLAALTALALLLHGYHPWADDGGLYVSGIEHLLHPQLFPHDAAFVDAHLRFSLFAPLLAASTRLTGLSLPWVLLLADLLSIASTLCAARWLLELCGFSPRAQCGGLLLLSTWWTLPVAGTALAIMDPYLTARSFSTPLALAAVALLLHSFQARDPRLRRRSAALSLLCLAAACAFHPLMGGYAAAWLALLCLQQRWPGRWTPLLLAAALACACALLLHLAAPPESAAVLAAERSRSYWYLSQWHGYEILGLPAPLLLLAALGRPHPRHSATRALVQTSLVLGLTSITIALALAHLSASTHLVARLQPLRSFVLLYALMVLLLGATLTDHLLRSPRRWPRPAAAALLLGSAAALLLLDRSAYPSTPHLELPSLSAPTVFSATRPPATPDPIPLHHSQNHSQNPWTEAFAWIRSQTPANALFALDADFIDQPEEDSQSFRALTLRSHLPDSAKDGGEASIAPALSDAWLRGVRAQTGLSQLSDAERDRRLLPLGVSWMLLRTTAHTAHPCPYRNRLVEVCSLPRP